MKKIVIKNLKIWLYYSIIYTFFLHHKNYFYDAEHIKNEYKKKIEEFYFLYLYSFFNIKKFFCLFFFKLIIICRKYNNFLNMCSKFKLEFKKKKLYEIKNLKGKYIEKGYKYKNLGIYLKNFINNNNDLYFQNMNNLNNSYCYLLIRLNRKNLFLTLLNNEGNVLCKTNIGSAGFKKKVKRTGYAIKGTGKKFLKKIKLSFVKNIYILNKKNIQNNENKNTIFQQKIRNLKLIEKKKKLKKIEKEIRKIRKYKLRKLKKKRKINNKIKNIKILKKNSKKIIRSKLLWLKILKNLVKYRIDSNFNLNNIIRKNLRIILRIRTSIKRWGFRFIVYGLFKKLRWFRGIEFRLPIPHSNSLRLKKKRRV